MGRDSYDARFADASSLYATVANAIGHSDRNVLGVNLEDVNNRLLRDVSKETQAATSAIGKTVADALSISKDVANDVSTLPKTTSREITSMQDNLPFEAIAAISAKVKMVLASFQNAVEDPQSLYPRLICCEVPVDPTKIMDFTKKHDVLERTYQADATLSRSDRSMPNPPKSAEDVITNVNSSLEAVSDLLLESVQKVLVIRGNISELEAGGQNLASANEPIDEMLNQQEEIQGKLNRLTALFSGVQTDESETERSLNGDRNALQIVREGSSLLESMKESIDVFEDAAAKLRSGIGVFAQMAENLKSLFVRGIELFKEFHAALKRFIASLPRIAQDIRQFFVPTGLRTLVMKPSADLISLLQSVEELQAALPEPDNILRSSKNVFGGGGCAERVESAKARLDELLKIPSRICEVIEKQDLRTTLVETVKRTLSAILQEIKDSTVGGVLDNVGDALGLSHIATKLDDYFPVGKENDESEDAGNPEQGHEGLLDDISGVTGLFGKLL